MSADENTPLSGPEQRGLKTMMSKNLDEVDLIAKKGRHDPRKKKMARAASVEEGGAVLDNKGRATSMAEKVGANYVEIFSKVAAANGTLPLISTLSLCACLSYYNYYTPTYVTMNSDTSVGRAAQFIYILSASISAACAVYSTVFFVLEGYYLKLAINSDDMNRNMVQAQLMNDSEYLSLRNQLGEDIEENWEYFTPHRGAARNCLWLALSGLFISASCELFVDAGAVTYLAIAGMFLMIMAIVFIWKLVLQFRAEYRPILARAQDIDDDRV